MYDATKLPWVPLSPNMPTFTTALLYHFPASRHHCFRLLTPQCYCNTVNCVQLPRSRPAGGHVHERRLSRMPLALPSPATALARLNRHSMYQAEARALHSRALVRCIYSISVLLSLESDYFVQVLRG